MDIVSYIRVSTPKQGESGLGAKAQRDAVMEYSIRTGARIVREFEEVESGRNPDRPKLKLAMAHCVKAGATLVVAKLDRLARRVKFVVDLMEGGCRFIALDMPEMNELTVHIMAAFAQHEAKAISERTKAALAAFRDNKIVPKRLRKQYPDGVPQELVERYAGKLGAAHPHCGWDGNPEGVQRKRDGLSKGREKSLSVRAERARKTYGEIVAIVLDLRKQNWSLSAIARKLNDDGHVTNRGKLWVPSAVWRVIAGTPVEQLPLRLRREAGK